MPFSRRKFVQAGAALATCSAVPAHLWSSSNKRNDIATDIQDPAIKAIADASLNVARCLGATYADSRLDHTYEYDTKWREKKESMSFGVRVLVDGYWGFASSPVWSKDEAARLASAAIRNARANTVGKSRFTELAPLGGTEQKLIGHWSTPVIDDPFEMSEDEIKDFISAFGKYVTKLDNITTNGFGAKFLKQDKLFVSTIGHHVTQQIYQTTGDFPFTVNYKGVSAKSSLDTVTTAGAGFEYIRGQPLREQIRQLVEEVKADMSLPFVPVDVGRYETILDANTVASLLSETIGVATELDRALGYEANAGGTSYIVDPQEMVGTLKIGSPELTVTANRSEALGAATVRWDDEGITPTDFTLVKDGVLNDMQTDREGASVLKEVYSRQQKTVHSYGCSYAPNSALEPLTHSANLQIKPSVGAESFDSLVGKVEKGIAFKRGSVDIDHQQISGLLYGQAFEVRNGERVARIGGAAIIFRTPELWNAVDSVGGDSSTKRIGLRTSKGQPARSAFHSVTGAPIALKETTVIDILRKA